MPSVLSGQQFSGIAPGHRWGQRTWQGFDDSEGRRQRKQVRKQSPASVEIIRKTNYNEIASGSQGMNCGVNEQTIEGSRFSVAPLSQPRAASVFISMKA